MYCQVFRVEQRNRKIGVRAVQETQYAYFLNQASSDDCLETLKRSGTRLIKIFGKEVERLPADTELFPRLYHGLPE